MSAVRPSERAKQQMGWRRRPGAALILVLWAIALLSLLAGGLTFTIRQDLAISNLQRDRLTAHVLARAGVERSMAAVTDDLSDVDTLSDLWCDDAPTMQEVPLTGGTFSVTHGSHDALPMVWYGASDESGKLNVNAASRDQLMALPEMTEPIAAAVIDWRDGDEEPQPAGIERSYYLGLAHPYTIRNGPLRTVRELLLVRDVTPELLCGEDANANGLLDPNEDDGDTSPPYDNADGRLDRGWLAYLTTYSYEKNENALGLKRVNINSADAGTLSQRLGLETWAAQSIVKAREKGEFKHLVDLLDVERDASTGRGPSEEVDLNPRNDDEKDQPVTLDIFKRIVDDITLSDNDMLPGRININTAPREVLETLPEVDQELAEAVLQPRANRGGFGSIGDLLDVAGMTKDKFAKLEGLVTVRSNVFRILSNGQASSGLAQATIECVVDRGGEVPRVLYWSESSP